MPPARRLSGIAALALCLLASACGESGSRETRPIEVLYYVSGPQDLPFQVPSEPAPECGGAAGIQAENADHVFGDRLFYAPHLFVLENARQPVRAAFENAAPSAASGLLRADLFLGTTLQSSASDIAPGDCGTVGTDTEGTLDPDVRGPEVRFEICARPSGGDRDAPCASDSPDARVAFYASLGDLEATNLTTCEILPLGESCRTPATFFMENAKDTVSAVISKYGAQNPDAIMRLELWIDGKLEDTDTGTGDVIVQQDL